MLTKQLLFTITTIVIGSSFQFGYQTGVINAPLQIIEKFINTTAGGYSETTINIVSSTIVAAFPVGGLIGALIGGHLANKFGRKITMLLCAFPTILGSVLMSISLSISWYPCLILGRIVIGISCGIYTGLAPMYLSEIAPLRIKGASGTINQFFIVIGVLVSQILGIQSILGNETRWPYLLGMSIVPCMVQLVLLLFCPESPRYLLLTKDDEDSARRALTFLRASPEIEYEIEEMVQEKEASRSSKKTLPFKELFNRRYLRLGVGISIGMQLSQQLSGINSVIYYSEKMFTKAGLSDVNASYATIGVGATNVLVTFISVLLVDRLGRKTLHLTGLSGMLVASIGLSICLILVDHWQPLVYFTMVFIFIFVAFFGIGPGAIPWFIVAEMFTQEARGGAMTIAVFVNWVCQIVIGLGYPQLVEYLKSYNFLPFVVTLFIFVVFTYKFVPETKGRTPEELENYFKRKVDLITLDDDEPLLTNASVGPIMVENDDDFRI